MSAVLCPTGCSRARKAGHLMCGVCWRVVPGGLQRDVYRTWRAWCRDLANADLKRDYDAASEAAIASVP